jgi:molybdenum cofactor biosynthesis protein MoaC
MRRNSDPRLMSKTAADYGTVSHRLKRRSGQVVERASWAATRNGSKVGSRRIGWLAIRQKHSTTLAAEVRVPTLTHLDKTGRASMVSISNKASTTRRATAKGRIYLPRVAFDMLAHDPSGSTWKKGDVFGTARIAGIMAGKRTSDMIPLCHPISLTDLKVAFRMDEEVAKDGGGWVSVKAVAECEGKTGVEVSPALVVSILSSRITHSARSPFIQMEALSAASVALLTVWDMVKAVAGKEMVMSDLMVTHKEGGKSGDWDRPGGWVAGEIKANEVDFSL